MPMFLYSVIHANRIRPFLQNLPYKSLCHPYHSLPYILNSAPFFDGQTDVWKEKKWLLLWTDFTLTHSYELKDGSVVFQTPSSTRSTILLPHIFHLCALDFYFCSTPCFLLYSFCVKDDREWKVASKLLLFSTVLQSSCNTACLQYW